MAMDDRQALDFDVESLALDVFEVVDSGLEIESLTTGHGMIENASSCAEQGGGTVSCAMSAASSASISPL